MSGQQQMIRSFRQIASTAMRTVCAGALALALAFGPVLGTASAQTAAPAPNGATAMAPGSAAAVASYRLGGGDILRVTVFGEPDLSGEFSVDDTGVISLPLIGQLDVGDLTTREVETRITALLSDGYLRNPRVNAEVINFRPFYIHGEVENGGEYPYVAGMTVLNAVALAGGYTYRANTDKIYITRKGAGEEVEMPADRTTTVQPGDILRVPERFF